MIHMTKQIYINIIWGIFCVFIWFLVSLSVLIFTNVLSDVRISKENSKQILSILQKSVSCELPYGVQDKIEQTYKNITSFECTTNP